MFHTAIVTLPLSDKVSEFEKISHENATAGPAAKSFLHYFHDRTRHIFRLRCKDVKNCIYAIAIFMFIE